VRGSACSKRKRGSQPSSRRILAQGRVGATYNIGGASEKKNLDVVHTVCVLLDKARPKKSGSYAQQISFVKDRPGHDRRYAIDAGKIRREVAWEPRFRFEQALPRTIQWYQAHPVWLQRVRSGAYRDYYARQYGR